VNSAVRNSENYRTYHYSSFHSKLPGSTMLPWLTVYNNVGLTSKTSEEIRREITENFRFRQPHCRRLTPTLQGTPANICINLILPESTVCGKKVSPKVFFAIFLATARNFYMKFHNLLLIHHHIKLLSSIVLLLIMTKLLNFLGDHVVISCVHGMHVYRTKNASYFVMWYKKSIVIWTTK